MKDAETKPESLTGLGVKRVGIRASLIMIRKGMAKASQISASSNTRVSRKGILALLLSFFLSFFLVSIGDLGIRCCVVLCCVVLCLDSCGMGLCGRYMKTGNTAGFYDRNRRVVYALFLCCCEI